MFCPSCFVEMKETRTIEDPGYVYSYTTVGRNRTGESSDNVTLALVKFEGVEGGIIHRLDIDASGRVEFGMKVVPILKSKPERTGALTDVISFKSA